MNELDNFKKSYMFILFKSPILNIYCFSFSPLKILKLFFYVYNSLRISAGLKII